MNYIEWTRLILGKLVDLMDSESYEFNGIAVDELEQSLSSYKGSRESIMGVMQDLEQVNMIQFKGKGYLYLLVNSKGVSHANSPQLVTRKIQAISLSPDEKLVLEYLVSLSKRFDDNNPYPMHQWATWEMLQNHCSLSIQKLANILECLRDDDLIRATRRHHDEVPYPEARATYYGFIKCQDSA